MIEAPDVLHGDRIALRPWRATDAQALWAAVDGSRAHLERWMPWAKLYTGPEMAAEFIARATAEWQAGTNLWLAIEERASGAIAGGTGFNTPDWRLRGFEIGYWLREDMVGRGYVTEAVRLLTVCVVGRFAARRVEIRCDPRNARSVAVIERSGYLFEGRLRNQMLDSEDEPRDTLVYALTDADWPRMAS